MKTSVTKPIDRVELARGSFVVAFSASAENSEQMQRQARDAWSNARERVAAAGKDTKVSTTAPKD